MSRRIIGLTGNIATGKSAVMRLAAERGALTIDADRVVHDLLATDAAIQSAVVAAFGPGVRRADGGIDRAVLGASSSATRIGCANWRASFTRRCEPRSLAGCR